MSNIVTKDQKQQEFLQQEILKAIRQRGQKGLSTLGAATALASALAAIIIEVDDDNQTFENQMIASLRETLKAHRQGRETP